MPTSIVRLAMPPFARGATSPKLRPQHKIQSCHLGYSHLPLGNLTMPPEQFEKILLKVNPDGSQVRLKDVAKVELGSRVYEPRGLHNGQPAAGLGINLAPGANQLQVASAIHVELEALQPYFPHGLQVVFPYDTSPYIILSLQEVVQTLVIAMLLVVAVMYIFLQNIRATLIPSQQQTRP